MPKTDEPRPLAPGERQSVAEIVEGMRGMLKAAPRAQTMILSREAAEELVAYFDDINGFKELLGSK